ASPGTWVSLTFTLLCDELYLSTICLYQLSSPSVSLVCQNWTVAAPPDEPAALSSSAVWPGVPLPQPASATPDPTAAPRPSTVRREITLHSFVWRPRPL